MQLLQFPDKCVSYETFLRDVAAKVALMIRADNRDPETVSQNRAYAMFGRGNVDRWRRQNRLTVYRRPGKVEYRTAELRYCQRTQQDY